MEQIMEKFPIRTPEYVMLFLYETARGGCLLGPGGLDHFGAGKTFL